MIVARLIQFGKLAGFHFNDSKYGDDDLDAGSIKPFQLFLIFNELVDAELERGAGLRSGLHARPVAQRDRSHRVADDERGRAACAPTCRPTSWIARRCADAQERCDALMALRDAEAGLHHRRVADPGHGARARGRRHRSRSATYPRQRLPRSARRRSGRPRRPASRRRDIVVRLPDSLTSPSISAPAAGACSWPASAPASCCSSEVRRFHYPPRAVARPPALGLRRASSTRSTPACARRAERARELGRPGAQHRGRQLGRRLRADRRRRAAPRGPRLLPRRADRGRDGRRSSRGCRARRSSERTGIQFLDVQHALSARRARREGLPAAARRDCC